MPVTLAVRSPPPELVKDYVLLSTIAVFAADFTKLEAFLEKGPMVFRSALTWFGSGGNFSVLAGRGFTGCITRSV